ncbi:MAG: hypothetical protein IAE92_10170 [Burkholderiaceae bacterium]|nr:hypothetical protein [Burkholderiaceae bacterium]
MGRSADDVLREIKTFADDDPDYRYPVCGVRLIACTNHTLSSGRRPATPITRPTA